MKNRSAVRSVSARAMLLLGLVVLALGVQALGNIPQASALVGSTFTTDSSCNTVNANLFPSKEAVYLDGGPHGNSQTGLPDGQYYVKVTIPSGATVLGTSIGSGDDNPVVVTGGEIAGCYQLWAILIKGSNGTQGYDDTTNNGGEYKVWLCSDSAFTDCKTDNFKVEGEPAGPHLTIEKDPSVTSVATTSTFTYSIVVTNDGGSDATNVVVTDSLTNGAVTQIAIAGGNYACETSDTFPCNLGTLEPGDSVTIVVTVDPNDEECAAVDNSATVTADDDLTATDSTGNEVTVTGCEGAVLTILKDPDVTSVSPGGTVVYTIQVINSGGSASGSVTVTDSLTNGDITDIDVDVGSPTCETTNTFPCSLGSIAANTTVTITVTVQAASFEDNSECADVDNSASIVVSESTIDTDDTGNAVSVICGPALTIDKTPSVETVEFGDTFTYTIVVTNTGTADALNVSVGDNLTGNGSITDIDVDTGSPACETSNTFPCSLGTLEPGDVVTITVTVEAGAEDCSDINNTATVTADGDILVSDGTGNEVDVTGCESDIDIDKDPSVDAVAQGGTFTYTIVVTNTGNATAQNVVVTDNLTGNGEISDISVNPGSPACETNNNFPCNLGDIASGDSVTITVTVAAGEEDCDPINNSATASASGGIQDTDSTGNFVTVFGCESNEVPTTPTPVSQVQSTPPPPVNEVQTFRSEVLPTRLPATGTGGMQSNDSSNLAVGLGLSALGAGLFLLAMLRKRPNS